MTKTKELLLELNKMSKKSVALYHRIAQSSKISNSALGVLYALYVAEEPYSQYDLCSQWFIPKQTINTTVTALQKRGLICLLPIAGTRNKKNIILTDEGKIFAKNTVGVLYDAESSALAELTAGEQELYIQLNKRYNAELSKKINTLLSE